MEWSAPVLTELYPDPNDKTIIAYSFQDCQAILDQNKERRDQQQKGDIRLVADIPNNVLYSWLVEEWARGNLNLRMYTPEWREMVRKKLRDPNYKYLLTSERPSRTAWEAKRDRFVATLKHLFG